MKPRLFGLLVLMLTVGSSHSLAAQGKVLGGKTGFNRARQVVEGAEDSAVPISGLVAGVFLRFNFGKYFGIQPEVLISRKGGTRDADILVLNDPEILPGGGAPGSARPMEVMYVEVPLLAYLRVLERGPVKQYFVAGPALAIEIDCHDQINDAVLNCQNSLQVDPGIVAGGGLDIEFARWATLSFEARHTWGLADINSVSPTVHNRTWSFMSAIGVSLW